MSEQFVLINKVQHINVQKNQWIFAFFHIHPVRYLLQSVEFPKSFCQISEESKNQDKSG